MADNYYNGNKVWNHILGGKSYVMAYANGKVVIDSVQKTTVNAYISGTHSSGYIEVAVSRAPASNLIVSFVASYDIYFTSQETGVTMQETRTYSNGSSFMKGSDGTLVLPVDKYVPYGYIFNGISFKSVRVTKVTPTSDEVYNYSY